MDSLFSNKIRPRIFSIHGLNMITYSLLIVVHRLRDIFSSVEEWSPHMKSSCIYWLFSISRVYLFCPYLDNSALFYWYISIFSVNCHFSLILLDFSAADSVFRRFSAIFRICRFSLKPWFYWVTSKCSRNMFRNFGFDFEGCGGSRTH